MREKRIGISSWIRPSLDSRRSSIGSRQFLGGFQPPCATRGVASRSALPAARRSSADMYAAGATKASFTSSCFAFVLRMLSSPPYRSGAPMSGIGPAFAWQRQREPQCHTRCQSKPQTAKSIEHTYRSNAVQRRPAWKCPSPGGSLTMSGSSRTIQSIATNKPSRFWQG